MSSFPGPFVLKKIIEGIATYLILGKKLATVFALHKKACSKHHACKYRPVSLTSVVGKLLEAIVKDPPYH